MKRRCLQRNSQLIMDEGSSGSTAGKSFADSSAGTPANSLHDPPSSTRGPSPPAGPSSPPASPLPPPSRARAVKITPLRVRFPGGPEIRLVYTSSSSSKANRGCPPGEGEGVRAPEYISISSSTDEEMPNFGDLGESDPAGEATKAAREEVHPLLALCAAPWDTTAGAEGVPCLESSNGEPQRTVVASFVTSGQERMGSPARSVRIEVLETSVEDTDVVTSQPVPQVLEDVPFGFLCQWPGFTISNGGSRSSFPNV